MKTERTQFACLCHCILVSLHACVTACKSFLFSVLVMHSCDTPQPMQRCYKMCCAPSWRVMDTGMLSASTTARGYQHTRQLGII